MRGASATAVGLASLTAGSLIGSHALFAIGAALSLAAAYAAAVVLAAAMSVSCDRRVGATEVVEGDPVEVEIRLTTGLRLGVMYELVAADRPPMPLHPGTNVVRIAFERRGRRLVEPSAVRLRDPLGFFTSQQKAGRSAPLLVLPRGLGGPQNPRLRSLPRDAEPVDLDGLGEYRAGTPASRLHWPSLARGAGLLERRLNSERVEAPLYVVDTSGAAAAADADRIVRSAVAQILQSARTGGCAVLLPGDDSPVTIGPDLRGWPDVHRRLAVLGQAD